MTRQADSLAEQRTGASNKLKIIDATTVGLCLQKYKRATFRKTKAGIKLHIRLAFVGEQDVFPEKATITAAMKDDRTQLEELVDEPGVTYVFDRISAMRHSIAIAKGTFPLSHASRAMPV